MDVSEIEAAHYVLGYGGFYEAPLWKPGSFYKELTHAAFLADHHNLERLRTGFPVLIAAVVRYKYEPGGSDQLAELVEANR